MENNLEKIYDGFAKTYDNNRGLFDMSEVFHSFKKHISDPSGHLLDLGCGAGDSFAKRFIDMGWSVTGIDFSQKMLELAKKHVPEMKTIHSDMRQVEFEPNQFHAITAIYSLFHLPSTDHTTLFKKFYSWLNPGGKLLFTYATKHFTGHDEFDGHLEFMGQQLFYSHTTPDRLYTTLKSIGFTINSKELRDIGNEVFLWVTLSKPGA